MKTEIYYFDSQGNACGEDQAVKIIIRELDDDGVLVQELFGIIEKKCIKTD